MRRLLAVTALALFICGLSVSFYGCATKSNTFLEGSQTTVGAYLPYEGQLFGVEVVQHTSGCLVRSNTNQTFSVDRTYASTNEYLWGAVKTTEFSSTKVSIPVQK